MNDRDKFEAWIATRPWDDDAARRVYADWLEEQGYVEEAKRQRRWVAAARWLRDAAKQCGPKDANADGDSGFTFDDMIRIGRTFIQIEEYFVQYDSELARDYMYANRETYWRCWSIITGEPVPEEFANLCPFACSC